MTAWDFIDLHFTALALGGVAFTVFGVLPLMWALATRIENRR